MNTLTAPVLRTARKPRKGIRALVDRRILGSSIAALVTAAVFLPGTEAAAGTATYDLTLGNGGFTTSGSPLWTYSASGWQTTTPSTVASSFLLSPVITLATSATASVSFAHTFNFENNFDGGILQSSVDGAAFSQVLAGSFTANGYNRTISSSFSSPISGLQAFSAAQLSSTTSSAGLGTVSGSGHTLQLRWFAASDNSVSSGNPSWRLTSITISGVLTALPPTHWLGGTDGKWTGNVNNWASDSTGTATTLTPTATDDITFSAAPAGNRSTTLEQDFTIRSLTIDDTTAVSIASGAGGPHILTISGGPGITVNNGANLTISANVTLTGASNTIAVNGNGVAEISGILDGTTGLNKTGSGKLTLSSGLNTYTGVTTISDGTLSIGMIANGGAVSDLGQSSSAASNLVFDGGALQYTGATAASDRLFTINNGKTAKIDVTQAATNLTLAGATGPATTGSLDKIGLGTLTLIGGNTYTGTTTVNAGTLAIDNDGAATFGALGSGPTTVNGGTLKFLKLANAGGGTFIVNGGAAAGTGGGTLSFYDTSSAGTGNFTINGPTLPGEPQGMMFFFNSATAATGNFTVNGGTVGAGSGGYVEFDSTSTAGNSIWNVKGGSAANAFGGVVSFFATTTAANANITISGGTAAGVTGANVNFNGTSTAGSATITIDGGTAAGAGGGILQFAAGSHAGSSTLAANGGSGGGAGGSIFFSGTSTGDTARVTLAGNSLLDISGHAAPGVSIGSLAGTAGTVSLGARNLTVGTNNSNTTFQGLIQDGGIGGGTGGSLTKVGTGTLRIDAFQDNTYTGGTFVNAGVLEVAGNGSTHSALGFGPITIGTGAGAPGSAVLMDGLLSTGDNLNDNVRVTVNSDGIFDISGTASGPVSHNFERVGSISGVGRIQIGASSLLAGRDNTDTTFSGVIDGAGGRLTKEGTGTMTLTGTNTYTGGTTLNAGTLAAGSVKAFGSGNLTLNAGTLRTTGGPLAVDIGAGNILFSGGTYVANVGGTAAGVNHDQLKTTGTANIGGGKLALVRQGGFVLSPGDKVKLLLASGGVAGGSAAGTPLPGAKVTGLSAFSNSPLLVPTVNVYTDSVILEAIQGSFAGVLASLPGVTPNQQALAGALDSAAKQLGGKTGLITEFNFLDTQPLNTLLDNLNKISPDSMTAIFTNAVALANVQSSNLGNHMSDIRSGGSTPSASGMAATGSGPSYSGAFAGPKHGWPVNCLVSFC